MSAALSDEKRPNSAREGGLPPLSELAMWKIAGKFEIIKSLSQIPAASREAILGRIDLARADFELLGRLVESETFWRRACGECTRLLGANPLLGPAHGKTSRQLFAEAYVQRLFCTNQCTAALLEKLEKAFGPHIRDLKIEKICAAPPEGVIAFVAKCPQLLSLKLCLKTQEPLAVGAETGFTPALAAAFGRGLRLEGLQSLRLPGNNIGADVLPTLLGALAGSRALSLLDLSHNPLRDPGAACLVDCLRAGRVACDALCLSDCELEYGAALALAEMLGADSPPLARLQLNMNYIDASGAEKLLESLSRPDAPLKLLDLSSNLINRDVSAVVADFLGKNTRLEELHLSGNTLSATEESLDLLKVQALVHPRLRTLNVTQLGTSRKIENLVLPAKIRESAAEASGG